MSQQKIPPAQSGDIQVCCISLNATDRIRLMGLNDDDVINAIQDVIVHSWGAIQEQKDCHGAHEFKLSGCPWEGQGGEAVQSRILLTRILQIMAKYGWTLLQAADVSKKSDDKNTLFFEKETPDPEADMFAVSFNVGDRIRIIGAPSIVACIHNAIESQWPNGIIKEKDYYGVTEIKLSGSPWFPGGADTVTAHMLLCQIIANVRAKGYKLYGSVDIGTGHEGMDLDSWVFRKVGHAWQ